MTQENENNLNNMFALEWDKAFNLIVFKANIPGETHLGEFQVNTGNKIIEK